MSECTYSLWEIAAAHAGFAGAGFALVYFCIKYTFKRCKLNANGKVNRAANGRFVSKKK